MIEMTVDVALASVDAGVTTEVGSSVGVESRGVEERRYDDESHLRSTV